jgi:hypothetical protein
MCRFPNGFRDRDISLYSTKIVNKKEILRTVSNNDIYCSSDKVGIVYISKTKLRGFSPQTNYTNRATAACRRS